MNKTIGHLIIKNSVIKVINTSHLEEIYKYFKIDTYDNTTDEENYIVNLIKRLNIIRITSYLNHVAIDFNVINRNQINILNNVLDDPIYLNISSILVSSYLNNEIKEFHSKRELIRYLRSINND